LALTFLVLAALGEAPVADAAMRGEAEQVRTLLRRGADVNAAQGDGMTALHWAASRGDTDMAAMLLYAGANREAATRVGSYTPLLVAARSGRGEMVVELLTAGADARAKTATGVTSLHYAAASGNETSVVALLDHGADIDAMDAASDQTPLMFAATYGRAGVVRLLVSRGADPALTSRVVDIPALEKDDAVDLKRRRERLEALRKDAPLVPVPDPTSTVRADEPNAGAPPVPEKPFAWEDSAKAAPKSEAGADAKASGTGAGSEADETAAPKSEEPTEEPEAEPLTYGELIGEHGGLTPLLLAARSGHTDAVSALLDAGADVNQVSAGDHTSPLLIATINGHFDLAMALLERGADPNLVSDAGAGPLYGAINIHWAPKSLYPQPKAQEQQNTTYLEYMEALLKAGADPDARLEKHLWYMSFNFDLLGVDTGGATPFWRAAYATDVAAMRLLMAHGADPGIPTRKPAERRRRGAEVTEDPTGLPPIPVGGPGVFAIHAASGVGYGKDFAANSHRHVPDGWLPAVKYLVEELGMDVNARDYDGYSALHHAASRGDNELIHYLVEKGGDVTLVSRTGQTTADMANGPVQRVQPFLETVALLEKLGSKNNHKCLSC
jgi:ankyrin repeat protein